MAALTTDNDVQVTIAEAATLIETMTDEGHSVMLWGAPGIGKTDIVYQLGERKKRKVIVFHASLRETVDVRGIPVSDLKTGTTRWLVPSELPNAERDGEFGYLFLDEYNQSSPQMQAALGGLLHDGTVGDYVLPKGWRVIAAGNRTADRASAQKMPTQARNRLGHFTVLPDVDAWCKWAAANGVPIELIAFVRFRRELLHRMPRGDENAYPTPRSLTKAGKYVKVADSNLRRKLFGSLIGADVAGELNGFIDLYQSIGGLDDIVANPATAPIPTEASQLWAVCTGLARMATRKNIKQIAIYNERLGREQQMLLMHDAAIRTPALKETAEYTKWAVKNQDVLMQS